MWPRVKLNFQKIEGFPQNHFLKRWSWWQEQSFDSPWTLIFQKMCFEFWEEKGDCWALNFIPKRILKNLVQKYNFFCFRRKKKNSSLKDLFGLLFFFENIFWSEEKRRRDKEKGCEWIDERINHSGTFCNF